MVYQIYFQNIVREIQWKMFSTLLNIKTFHCCMKEFDVILKIRYVPSVTSSPA